MTEDENLGNLQKNDLISEMSRLLNEDIIKITKEDKLLYDSGYNEFTLRIVYK